MSKEIEKQKEILDRLQQEGYNVCTCGNCGGVILYDDELANKDFINCPHCKVEMEYCHNPHHTELF